MNRIIVISTCDGCPFLDIDNGYIEERWGKNWCDKLDLELKTVEIPDYCPLPETDLPDDIFPQIKK